MKAKQIQVWLQGEVDPIVFNDCETYVADGLFCVLAASKHISKYPVCNISGIFEDCGSIARSVIASQEMVDNNGPISITMPGMSVSNEMDIGAFEQRVMKVIRNNMC